MAAAVLCRVAHVSVAPLRCVCASILRYGTCHIVAVGQLAWATPAFRASGGQGLWPAVARLLRLVQPAVAGVL